MSIEGNLSGPGDDLSGMEFIALMISSSVNSMSVSTFLTLLVAFS